MTVFKCKPLQVGSKSAISKKMVTSNPSNGDELNESDLELAIFVVSPY
jgi:hypothetical protein